MNCRPKQRPAPKMNQILVSPELLEAQVGPEVMDGGCSGRYLTQAGSAFGRLPPREVRLVGFRRRPPSEQEQLVRPGVVGEHFRAFVAGVGGSGRQVETEDLINVFSVRPDRKFE